MFPNDSAEYCFTVSRSRGSLKLGTSIRIPIFRSSIPTLLEKLATFVMSPNDNFTGSLKVSYWARKNILVIKRGKIRY
jgi:hypothetical protein